MFSEASLNYNGPLLSVFISILTALFVLKIFRCCDRVDMPTWGYFRHQLSSPFPSCYLCLRVCITLRSLLTGHPNQKSTAYLTISYWLSHQGSCQCTNDVTGQFGVCPPLGYNDSENRGLWMKERLLDATLNTLVKPSTLTFLDSQELCMAEDIVNILNIFIRW